MTNGFATARGHSSTRLRDVRPRLSAVRQWRAIVSAAEAIVLDAAQREQALNGRRSCSADYLAVHNNPFCCMRTHVVQRWRMHSFGSLASSFFDQTVLA